MFKYLIIITTFILLSISNGFSEELLVPNCPEEDPNCEDWEETTLTIPLTAEGNTKAEVLIKYRFCNGVLEYQYLEIIAIENGEYLQDSTIFETDFSALRELLDVNVIEQSDNLFNSNIPPCEERGIQIRFYGATCGVWVKCSFKIDPASQECDEGYEGNPPVYDNGGESWVDVYKWQSCGETCCKKEYEICSVTDPETREDQIFIRQVSKGPTRDCDQQGQFIDWKTGEEIQCIPGC